MKDDWKPTYFYIKYVTVGELLPIIKEAFFGYLSVLFFLLVVGFFYTPNSANSAKDSFLGITNFFWFLIIFAAVTWFLRGKERIFRIQRYDTIEWVLFNICFCIFVISSKYLEYWGIGIVFATMMFLLRLYEDMVFIGKSKYRD